MQEYFGKTTLEDTFFLALRNFFSDSPTFAPGKRVNSANPAVTIIDFRNERLYNSCFIGDTLSGVAEQVLSQD